MNINKFKYTYKKYKYTEICKNIQETCFHRYHYHLQYYHISQLLQKSSTVSEMKIVISFFLIVFGKISLLNECDCKC